MAHDYRLQPKVQASVSLNEALETFVVMTPGMWENSIGPLDWCAVCNDDGIIAYFGKEEDACRFRLAEINRLLNG